MHNPDTWEEVRAASDNLRSAAVVVSKLDRLSRDVHFISGLMTHKVAPAVRLGTPRRAFQRSNLLARFR
jgi:hypothetical protein